MGRFWLHSHSTISLQKTSIQSVTIDIREQKLCSHLEIYVSYVCRVYILSVINCIFDCLSLKVMKLTTFSHIRRIAYSIQRYMEHTLS